jgi:hypothetical protein
MSDPAKALKENYYYFTRADQTAAEVHTTFVLPLGVTCTRCVLQFRWTTGNSCYGGHLHAVIPCRFSCCKQAPTATSTLCNNAIR